MFLYTYSAVEPVSVQDSYYSYHHSQTQTSCLLYEKQIHRDLFSVREDILCARCDLTDIACNPEITVVVPFSTTLLRYKQLLTES